MIRYTTERQVNRSAADTFDVIGTRMYENHPKWEREVVAIRPITSDPVGVGSRAVMVRREFGRTSESEYLVTEFEPHRRIAALHPDDSMDFNISFEITPIDRGTCTVQVDVSAEIQGWMRILEPIMGLAMRRRGERITGDMVEVIENAAARM